MRRRIYDVLKRPGRPRPHRGEVPTTGNPNVHVRCCPWVAMKCDSEAPDEQVFNFVIVE